MENLLKHLAIRLWAAILTGSLVSLVVLPPFAGAVGPRWMVLPGCGLIAAVYWSTGVLFAVLGRRRLDRLLKEATVWERAGMPREARHALTRASAVVDSFFFSPFSRRKPAGRLLARMARFQLAQTERATWSDPVIKAYLIDYPRDRDAATKWLDQVLASAVISPQTHDIAARVGAANPNDVVIQRMLAQLYLAERRCDFSALQTYRQLIDTDGAMPEDMGNTLTDLFLSQRRADSLALKVYLDAQQKGNGDRRLLPGIAACSRTIHPGPLTLPLLDRTDALLADINASQRRKMADAFLPDGVETDLPQPARRRPVRLPPIRDRLHTWSAGIGGLVAKCGAGVALLFNRTRTIRSSEKVKWMARWAGMGLLVVGVGWLVINTAVHFSHNLKKVEKSPLPAIAPITDPFTLQVAAYLKETDARRYVEQLKKQDLDAYWNRASGAGKIWYQVRIFHFKTKDEARAYGEDLKKRQIIGDYYVANYKRSDIP